MGNLKPRAIVHLFYRSLFLQAGWNPERMQGLGYCFSVLPFVKKLIKNKADRIHFLNRNLEFFNTHPYMSTWIIGATIKLAEQQLVAGASESVSPERFKKRMSEQLAALGDQIFWCLVRPISAMLGILSALYFGILGPVVFLVAYNIPHLYVRIKGSIEGYNQGFNITKKVTLGRFKGLIDALNKSGAILLGVLIVLSINTHYIINFKSLLAFLSGLILMWVFLKWKWSVPKALIALMTLAGIAHTILSTLATGINL
ncbi:MAG: PTS system mannose/fructose/sorbose family transporter subunit IID [bacterium]